MNPIIPEQVRAGKIYAMFNRAFFVHWFIVFKANHDFNTTGSIQSTVYLDMQMEFDNVNAVTDHPCPNVMNLQVIDMKKQLQSDLFELNEDEIRNLIMEAL